jgi:signal transduction histidine kinase
VVRLSTVTEEGNVAWSVADCGPGISEEDRARLFERFFTVATDEAGDGAGAGLGLRIVQAVALAHGGAIEVESGVGKGSTLAEQQPASVSLGGGELVELARQG